MLVGKTAGVIMFPIGCDALRETEMELDSTHDMNLQKICFAKLLKECVGVVWLLFVLLKKSLLLQFSDLPEYDTQDINDEESIERGNAYIDKSLNVFLSQHGHEYDPYKMDDRTIGFSKKVMFINVSGEAKLHEGYITGLSSLHRTGNCKLRNEDDRLVVESDLGAGVLRFQYAGTAKFMHLGPTITVHGEIPYVEVYMVFDVDATTGQNGTLTKFRVNDMRGIAVWITGLGPLNWAVNTFISAVMTIFKGYVRNTIENQMEKQIASLISQTKFPLDDHMRQQTSPENEMISSIVQEDTSVDSGNELDQTFA